MKSARKLLLILMILLSSFSKSYATIYYVNASATGNQNGLTWMDAFTDLQAALSVVIYGDEIWVAAGQYKPTTSTSRTASFILKDGVNIYGGFSGNETSIVERDIANNPTALNGDIGQSGVISDNSYNVIKGSNITSDIILDGFRIMNGNCNGSSQTGGGLRYVTSMSGHLFIRNCYFYANKAYNYGGAIYLNSSKVTIENCEFVNNQSGNGGGIYTSNHNDGYSTLVIRDSKFIGNVAYSGAAHDNSAPYQSIIIDRCIFTNNSSDNGIVQIDEFNDAKILNSFFVGNKVDTFSPSFISIGELNGNSTSKKFEMVNCTVAHNFNVYDDGIQGEMIQLHKSHYQMRNCIIYGNTPYAGRQMSLGNVVSNCLIQNGYINGINIIDANPQFVNPNSSATSNFNASTFDYSLVASSPCVNAGGNNFVNPLFNLDLEKEARIQGCVVDLGCYESSNPHVFHTIDTIIACESYTWMDSITYTGNNNTATVTLQSSSGCDSIITLNLTIGFPTTGIDFRTICANGSLQWLDGNIYTTENNSATHTLTSVAGCDSVVTLNLTVLPGTSGTDIRTACGAYTWIDGHQYTESNNTATFILENVNGCDSVVHLDLTIYPYPTPTIIQNGDTLSTQLFSSYKWKRNGFVISGATSQTYVVTQSGNYSVTVNSSDNCSGTSAIKNVTIDNVGLEKNEKQSILLFPNPANSLVTISNVPIGSAIRILDKFGKVIYQEENSTDGRTINTSILSAGMYIVQVINEGLVYNMKLMISK